jgi:hypothetical protein
MEVVFNIDDQLFNRAKQYVQATGQSMDAFIAQSIETALEQYSTPTTEDRFCLPQAKDMKLLPGIDLSNSAELLDIMEEGLDISQLH